MDYGITGKSSLRNELMQESSDMASEVGDKMKEREVEVKMEPE